MGAAAATFGPEGCCGARGAPENAGDSRGPLGPATWGASLAGIGEVTCGALGRAGCCARVAGAAGSEVPQNPQNLLPAGNVLWHFGHSTGIDGGVGREAEGVAAWRGFPHRAQVAALAGFSLPHVPHRIVRFVTSLFVSADILSAQWA